MSNETKVQALTALAKQCGAITYTHRSNPHEAAVSFGPMAWEKFVEASARQLAEQPGFVMVPVGDMAEIKEALDICVSLLESARSNHLPRILVAFSKAEAIVKAENCDCPAKDMPFGRCCKARPLTASPTAPSTEASEPARDERAEPVAWVLYFTNESGQPMREPFFSKAHMERHKLHNETMRGLDCRVEPLYTTPPPAPVLSDAEITQPTQRPDTSGTDPQPPRA